jgi:Uma2 family endonuclease
MRTINARRRLTASEFLTHPAANQPSELVRGRIRLMSPASGARGAIAGVLFAALDAFVEAHGAGMCFPDNTGFLLPGLGDTVRSPDVAFVSAARLPKEGIGPGWIPLAPDLVVKILSPGETPAELEDKLADYRTSGTQLIWIVDPRGRTVSVQAVGEAERQLAESEILDGGDVLPGFELPIARLFARLAG